MILFVIVSKQLQQLWNLFCSILCVLKGVGEESESDSAVPEPQADAAEEK